MADDPIEVLVGSDGVSEVARKDLIVEEFVWGILHHVARQRHPHQFPFDTNDRKFHKAFGAAYRALLRGPDEGLDPDFTIRPHYIHGDSERLREALTWLFGLGVLQGVGGSYVRVFYDTAAVDQSLIDRLPGRPGLYEDLATVFLDTYEARADGSDSTSDPL